MSAFAGSVDVEDQLCIPTGRLQRTGQGKHFLPQRLLRQGERFTKALGLKEDGQRVLRFENALCLVQDELVMLLPGAGGRSAHDAVTARLLARRRSEAEYLRAPTAFVWADPVPAARFEELVHQLVQHEPGVRWVRPVGAAFDRDAGRDLIADWYCSVQKNGEGLSLRRVIVQCKVRGRGVGKSDIRDIRDTLEMHAATGMLVVTPNWLTAGLVDHLDHMRQQERYWMDWWTQAEVEARLRLHPDVTARFKDVVVEVPGSQQASS